MNSTIKYLLAGLVIAVLAAGTYVVLENQKAPATKDSHADSANEHDDEDGHEHEGNEAGHAADEDHEEGGQSVELPADSAALDDIKTEVLKRQSLPRTMTAPGEVRSNSYRSSAVTTRIAAHIISRHARLGEHVEPGQPLVTLTSVEVAEAQGQAQIKAREWSRVQTLGEDIVGSRRYQEAQVEAEQARARLLAYGLKKAEIDRLIKQPEKYPPNGRFRLYSPRAGTVLSDDFVEGAFVEAGTQLFLVADESVVWVEANLAPNLAGDIEVGDSAEVLLDGDWHKGTVVQKHHVLNETTRTIPVRIELEAPDHSSHAGEFVQCRLTVGGSREVLSIPESALVRDEDGEWAVFVQEEPRHFERKVVKVSETSDGQAIISGLSEGTTVVTEGAFFLNSELAKGGFEVHNH